jgi:hypothetical protein
MTTTYAIGWSRFRYPCESGTRRDAFRCTFNPWWNHTAWISPSARRRRRRISAAASGCDNLAGRGRHRDHPVLSRAVPPVGSCQGRRTAGRSRCFGRLPTWPGRSEKRRLEKPPIGRRSTPSSRRWPEESLEATTEDGLLPLPFAAMKDAPFIGRARVLGHQVMQAHAQVTNPPPRRGVPYQRQEVSRREVDRRMLLCNAPPNRRATSLNLPSTGLLCLDLCTLPTNSLPGAGTSVRPRQASPTSCDDSQTR